jgi:hypothetical protein
MAVEKHEHLAGVLDGEVERKGQIMFQGYLQ